jgi:hypothetical protein
MADEVSRAQAPARDAALGDPLDKNTDIGAINSASSSRASRARGLGEDEGAERWAPLRLPERGFWFPPTIFTGVTQAHRIAREEIFGPVLSVLTFRTPAEASRRPTTRPTACPPASGPRRAAHPVDGRAPAAGVVWANTFNRFDPTSPFGGYKESGYGREGGSPGWPPRRGVAHDVATMRPLEVRKTYKLFIGGAFPRSESGRTYEVLAADGTFLANAKASRKDGRDAVVAARKGFACLERRDRLQPRPGAVPRRRAAWRAGATSSSTRSPPGVSADQAVAEVDAAIDRWVWYAGWTDKLAQVLVGEPSPGLLQLLCRSRPASSSPSRPIDAAPGPGRGGRARPGRGQRRRRAREHVRAAPGDHADRGPGDQRRARRRRQRPHRPPGEILPWLASHADVNGSTWPATDRRDPRPPGGRGGRHAQARPRPPPASGLGRGSAALHCARSSRPRRSGTQGV